MTATDEIDEVVAVEAEGQEEEIIQRDSEKHGLNASIVESSRMFKEIGNVLSEWSESVRAPRVVQKTVFIRVFIAPSIKLRALKFMPCGGN